MLLLFNVHFGAYINYTVSMRKALSKKETLNKIIRMFLAQYLTTVGKQIWDSEDFSAFQNDSLNLLTAYIRACTVC